TTDHISAAKTKLRHHKPKGKTAGKAKPAVKKHQGGTPTAAKAQPASGKRQARRQAAPKRPPQPAAKPGSGAGTLSIQDVATLTELVRRVGGAELRSLIDLLAH